jgi:NAD(P)-dependent dehydrogenase (short-subunit alcohol dehydrogenase family)
MTAKRTEDPQKMADELPHIPWDRPSEPWKVARLALYLASDDADYADAGVELVGEVGEEHVLGHGSPP